MILCVFAFLRDIPEVFSRNPGTTLCTAVAVKVWNERQGHVSPLYYINTPADPPGLWGSNTQTQFLPFSFARYIA